MKVITGWDRQQVHLLPERIEDYVGADNPVRFLDAFVAKLDLVKAGFRAPKADPLGRGRPGYQAGDLLRLYLYGYLHQIRSSRKLEAECQRNLEVIWLLRKLSPDFKTIADFRKVNAPAFKAVAGEFVQLCRQLELFGGQLLAIDGTKIKGQNAADQNWSQTKLVKQQARTAEKLQEYVQALAQADAQGPALPVQPGAEVLQAKIAQLEARQATIQGRLNGLQETGETQVSATDPESRGMRGAQGHLVGYNVQGAADAKHHLLAVVEVTNAPCDQEQLAGVAQAAKTALALTQATVVADGGYHSNAQIKACQDLGLEPLLPKGKQSSSERAGRYGKADFVYDAAQDSYACPAGATLDQRHRRKDGELVLFTYTNRSACARCPLKARCTESEYRTVSRWEHEASLERMYAQVAAAPHKLAMRKTLIEHCWGTLKWLLRGGFLVRGLVKTQAEASLAHVAYNLKRALAVVGLEKLLLAVKNWRPGAGGAPRPCRRLRIAAGKTRPLALPWLHFGNSAQIFQRRLAGAPN